MKHIKGFHDCNSPTHEGKTNTWFTPKEVTDVLGNFDLDPCSETFRPHEIALRSFCNDNGECGKTLQWNGRVWLNPPYGKEIGFWLSKLALHGNGIALVFSRTETLWAQEILKKCDAVNFIKGRISFIKSDLAKGTSAANGSMLLAFGIDNIRYLYNIPGIVYINSREE